MQLLLKHFILPFFGALKSIAPPIYILLLTILLVVQNLLIAQSLNDYQNGIHTTTNGRQLFFHQDSEGFIWGMDNLCRMYRYDGNRYHYFRYDPDDPTSLRYCTRVVNSIIEDKTGKIWLATDCHFTQYDPIINQFKYFDQELIETSGSTSADFSHVLEDSRGHIWITSENGVFRYIENNNKETFHHYPGRGSMFIFEDKNQHIWYSNYYGDSNLLKLKKVDAKDGTINDSIIWKIKPELFNVYQIYPKYSSYHHIESNHVTVLSSQIEEYLVIWRGLPAILNLQDKSFTPILDDLLEGETIHPNIKIDDKLLFGSSFGRILIFDSTLKKLINSSISKNFRAGIFNILKTNSNILLITTNAQTHKFFPENSQFKFYPKPNNLRSDSKINRFDPLVKLNGHIYFNSKTGFIPVRKDSSIPVIPVEYNFPDNPEIGYFICQDTLREKNWIIAYQGLNKITIYTFDKNWKLLFKKNETELVNYPGRRVLNTIIDHEGSLWICFYKSLSKLEGNTFINYTPQSTPQIKGEYFKYAILDREGDFWIAHKTAGVTRFNPNKEEFKSYNQFEGNALNSNSIWGLAESQDGDIWIGTEYGINRWSRKDKVFKIFLPLKLNAGPIIQDLIANNNIVWGSTGRDLLRYLPEEDNFFRYDLDDGVPDNVSFYSFQNDSDGFLYTLGSKNSDPYNLFVLGFHPDSIHVNKEIPELKFTNFSLGQDLVRIDSTGILKQSINLTDHLILNHDQNALTIAYTAPYFYNAENIQYRHQLVGLQKDIQYVGQKLDATYTNLDPGEYTFQVEVANHHLQWSEKPRTLKITILPPWWLTWWAKVIYATFTGLLLYGLYKYFLNRRLAQAETLRLKELDEVKTKLYTNITHEFRTPLTVIQGLSSQIEEKANNVEQDDISDHARILKRNGEQLLNLVNQMLDLQKLESGKMTVQWTQGDIIPYIQYTLDSFHSLAEAKHIQIHFIPNPSQLIMDYDSDKLLIIISNLISNAIKFTPENGQVYLILNQINQPSKVLQIKIRDTGIGIPKNKLPHIFDSFYQVDDSSTRDGEGTGIGLTLTKELVQLLGGSITASSSLNKGTEFEVLLPINNKAEATHVFNKDSLKVPIINTEHKVDITSNANSLLKELPLALIVEDNADLRQYLHNLLSNSYQIITAVNGQEGIEKAVQQIPDIIISDIMMPLQDGYELCQSLKTDERTSHIPIVLLTAKADIQSRISGIQIGADAYLSKPFNERELFVQIETLLQLRTTLQVKYARLNFVNFKSNKKNLEDGFLLKVKEIVETNLSNSDFGLAQLCKALGLSRSQVFRKLKALTGKSTTLIIRYIRLQHAKDLLNNSKLNIAEIAYEVGYEDPAYFTRNFTEEFGMSPSSFRTQ